MSQDANRRMAGGRSWIYEREDAQCRERTNAQLIEEAASATWRISSDAAEGDRAATLSGAAQRLSACGYAASYDVAARLKPHGSKMRTPKAAGRGDAQDTVRELHVAVVREPLERFIASHVDHAHRHCPASGCGPSAILDVLAESAKQLGALAAAGETRVAAKRTRNLAPSATPFAVHLVPPNTHIHAQTQSYFLSATDARGMPIAWNAIINVAHMDDAMPLLSQSIFGTPSPFLRPAAPLKPSVARADGGGHPAQNTLLKAAMLNRTDSMCALCRYLAQDYICLGFDFPTPCLQGSCRRTLSPAVQEAMVAKCAAQRWPPHCVNANVDAS